MSNTWPLVFTRWYTLCDRGVYKVLYEYEGGAIDVALCGVTWGRVSTEDI